MNSSDSKPVLIVGAGPSGLVLAIELARRNVPFRLIDRLTEPLGWDRAIFIKSRTLEILADLGIADEFLAHGQIVEGVDIYQEDVRAASYRFEDLDTPYPFILSIPEDRTEGILIGHLESLGGLVERGLEFIGLDQSNGDVRVHLRSADDNEQHVDVSWVVGTDGVHSAVREAVADEFDGRDYPLLWGVVDTEIANWRMPRPIVAAQLKAPVVIPFPLGDTQWRIYFRTELAHPDVLTDIGRRLRILSPGAELRHTQRPEFFHAHSRVARRFRVGRVFLAGDAAHASNPVEGHGMNAGIQDAFNLGWKLGLITAGAGSDRIADSYEPERRPVAQTLAQSGDEMEARIAPSGSASMLELISFLSTAEGREMAALAESELSFVYDQSPIIHDETCSPGPVAAGTPVGLRVGNAAGIEGPNGATTLHELMAGPHATLLYLAGESNAATIAQTTRMLEKLPRRGWFGPEICVVVSGDVGVRDEHSAVFHDTTGAAHVRLAGGQPCLCLIRPDGHLSYRCEPGSNDGLRAHLEMLQPRQQ